MGRTCASASMRAFSTRSLASGSIKRTTQPPPPAPQTLPASSPFRRAPSITRSMVFVEIVGKFLLRKDHSSVIRRPASCQSGFSMATRIFWATSEMRSKLFCTARLPPMCALRSEEHTSELQSQSNLVCRLLLEKKKKDDHAVIDQDIIMLANDEPVRDV